MIFSSGIHLINHRNQPYARKRPSKMLQPTEPALLRIALSSQNAKVLYSHNLNRKDCIP